jgi:hypothetical protein
MKEGDGMASEGTMRTFAARRLEAFIASALVAQGIPEPDAAICGARMVEADLRGVDTTASGSRRAGSTCAPRSGPSARTR